jgi:hypothetical protein
MLLLLFATNHQQQQPQQCTTALTASFDNLISISFAFAMMVVTYSSVLR